jgi:hypothetical protein
MKEVDQMKERGATDAAVARLEEMVRNARAVPLTDQVRVNLKQAKELVGELREALAAERRRR